MRTRLADCGDDVWAGNFKACNKHRHNFPLVIHAWRPNLKPEDTCDVVNSRSDNGTLILPTMYEGRPMTECGVPMNKLIEYMQRPGKILCHCHAGGTRAPSLAIFAKAARGCDPQKAIGEVIAALQYQYADAEVCATFNIKPLCEVFQRWPRKVEVAHV